MNKTFNHQTGNHLEIDGAKIYYEEIPNAGKPVLIFLHGGMGDIEDFNLIVPLFAPDFHIVGIDSRGHGKSTLGAEKLTYRRLQLDAEAVINHLQLKNVNIIGYSDGGIVAYRLALSNDISIEKLVTIGAMCNGSAVESNIAFIADVPHETFTESIHFKRNFEFYEQYNPQPDTTKFIDLSLQMWCDKSENGYPSNIKNINVPTLVISGNDELDPLETFVETVAKIPNAILFNIPFEGHLAWEKYPQFLVQVTNDFLRKQEPVTYIVTENYVSEFPNPISLTAGEKATIGEESSEQWLHWVYCTKNDNSNAGWVPKQIINYADETIIEDYSANEMTVKKGEVVVGLQELNGWLWARNAITGEMGWIPLENLAMKS
ncbi:MAG: alpha/beta fold hydrolase [Dysgonamonadaceae bacterium]|jgi:pimeloyl-ACP methyl ester carboxylesterase|nr:alpha/beta fold hydrolase [Dysgonamonadaceae bacterium]